MARMPYEIIFSPEAEEDFNNLKAHHRAMVRDALQKHLRHEPVRQSKSRIKRLKGISHPQYRLRVNEFRIYYDVFDRWVGILAIIEKSQAIAWLKRIGVPE
jgi:mRNA interferase RelE/StbE